MIIQPYATYENDPRKEIASINGYHDTLIHFDIGDIVGYLAEQRELEKHLNKRHINRMYYMYSWNDESEVLTRKGNIVQPHSTKFGRRAINRFHNNRLAGNWGYFKD